MAGLRADAPLSLCRSSSQRIASDTKSFGPLTSERGTLYCRGCGPGRIRSLVRLRRAHRRILLTLCNSRKED